MKRASFGVWVLVVGACASGGCAASSEGDSRGVRASEIVNGTASPSSDDAVVMVLAHDPRRDTSAGQYFERCTGTLLSPRIVLTARHCVSPTTQSGTFTCDMNGEVTSGTGGRFDSDVNPAETYVLVGTQFPARLDPPSLPHARAFVHGSSAVVCNSDLALVVMDEPIPDARIAPVRLASGVQTGATVDVVGWGATETRFVPSQRQRRDGVMVVDVGPSSMSYVGGELGANEFLATESVCFGDSGGTAFDRMTGAVVGVVSRGPNNGTMANGAGCVDTQHTFMTTRGFASLITEAFAMTGETPWIEGQPQPGTADAGAGGEDAGASDGGGDGASAGDAGLDSGTGGMTRGGCSVRASRGRAVGRSGLGALAALGVAVCALRRGRRG